ncbi:MAG: tetratricopeptide repeat protein, partial [Pyrinomonadaceae bacterium]
LYLPSIGFCYLVALLSMRLAQRHAAPAIYLTGALLLSFGASTMLQNRVWHDSIALWGRAVEKAPHYWAMQYNLALAHLDHKDYATAYSFLVKAAPNATPASAPLIYNNLALAQMGLGDTDGAYQSLQKALASDPRRLEAHNNLGTLLFERRDYVAARGHFASALERDPTSLSARFNLARTLAVLNDRVAAAKEFEAVLTQNPGDVEARRQLEALGRTANVVSESGVSDRNGVGSK